MGTGDTAPETLLERLFNPFEQERWEQYPEVLADDVVVHEDGGEMHGMEELLEFEKEYKESSPDAGVTVKEMGTSENTVFSR